MAPKSRCLKKATFPLLFCLPLLLLYPVTGTHSQHNVKTSTSTVGTRERHPIRSVPSQMRDSGSGNAFTATRSRTSFEPVKWVALTNVSINTLRRDPDIPWQMRFPRVLWEITIIIVASRASQGGANLGASIYLLLSLITGTTAVVDIFVWAPVFAFFARFETCTGGWFTGQPRRCTTDYWKGFGRLLVSAQALLSGVFYLMTAILAWGAFTAIRDEQRIEDQVRAIYLAKDKQQSQILYNGMAY